MDLKRIPIAVILTTILFFAVTATNAQHNAVEPSPFDLLKPLIAIYEKLVALADFSIVKTVMALLKIVINCLIDSGSMKTINFTLLNDELEHLVNSFPNGTSIATFISTDGIADFCNTAEFESLFNDAWRNDSQVHDMLKFFSCFGVANAGDILRSLHNKLRCKGNATIIPVESPLDCHSHSRVRESKVSKRIHEDATMFTNFNAGECKWDEYWEEAKIPELLQLFATYKQQMNTVSMRMLIGKLQEPAKGKEVRRLRLNPAIHNVIKELDKQILGTPMWRSIFEKIQEKVGINFFDVSFVETLVNLFELFVWGTVFATP